MKVTRNKTRIYQVNEDIFKTMSSDVAYMIGFITADGCIFNSKDGQDELSIRLNKKDLNVVEYISSFITPEKSIERYRNYAIFRVRSNTICKDLLKYNIYPQKTSKEKLPPLDLFGPYKNCYLKGLFDGDGSICVKYNINKKCWYLKYQICSGSKSFLEEVKENLGFGYGGIYKGKGNWYYWSVQKRDHIIQMYKNMYDTDGFCLDRKKERFNQIL